jgi:hypothetical protein
MKIDIDKTLNNAGETILGGALFAICYGIATNDSSIFLWGLLLWGINMPFAIYFFIKYKMWRREE